MKYPDQLTIEEQRQRLETLGITFKPSDRERDLSSIRTVGYYKLKEFAMPFNVSNDSNNGNNIEFYGINFGELITRYYQDKNLRINLLHAIESIEVYLQNELSYVLGSKYGAFGYLRFSNWCDRRSSRFDIEEKQYYFKKSLLKKIRKSNMPDIRYERNINSDGFPSIWLMIDALTFGDTLMLLKIMAPSNLKIISDKFECTSKELLSWLGCLNLVRNTCCHNSDLLDIRFKTQPMVPQEYADKIIFDERSHSYSRRIAIAIFIVIKLMKNVNSKYNFRKVQASLRNIINGKDELAMGLGFANEKVLKSIPASRKPRRSIQRLK
ncbi:CAAX protease [Lactiplantibacillus plantarum]|nr:CAAX protease [Lactiplantibacillus plantarum]MCG0813728.1 CAAX protease [Lactiplantibacillus plantarum]MCG0879075.1 CAAX protease [Lactiplantibacillus plantarum]MCG0951569.1 CAAX protease [Lactiplantibacillus plantarum]